MVRTEVISSADATEFLAVARAVTIRTHVGVYPLADAHPALAGLRGGRLSGAAVLVP